MGLLEKNTTITNIILTGEDFRKNSDIVQFNKFDTGERIGADGAKTLGELLKDNTTIRSLDLSSLFETMNGFIKNRKKTIIR